jgi:putative hydrolase
MGHGALMRYTLIDRAGKISFVGPCLALGALLNRMIENLRAGQSLLESVMTSDQRTVLGELQALMSLAEGYSNHVMNSVGSRLLPSFDEIHEKIEHRQKSRGRAEELFLQLTGLRLKMEQYKVGEQFANRVAAARGVGFLNRAWEAEEHLPDEAELRDPERWIARIEQRAA